MRIVSLARNKQHPTRQTKTRVESVNTPSLVVILPIEQPTSQLDTEARKIKGYVLTAIVKQQDAYWGEKCNEKFDKGMRQ
jgi:hypothetical protein